MVPVVALLGLQAGINSVLYLTSFGLIAGCTMVAFIPTPVCHTHTYRLPIHVSIQV